MGALSADGTGVLVDTRASEVAAEPRSRLLRMRFDHKIVLVSALPWAVLFVAQALGRERAVFLDLPLIYLGAPHVLATAALFVDPGLRSHVRAHRTFYIAAPIVTITACVAVFTFSPRTVAGVAILGLTLWQIHHFTKQNLGMFAFWTKARGMSSASAAERKVIQWTSAIGMAGIVRIAGRTGWIPHNDLVDALARGVGAAALVTLTVGAIAVTWRQGHVRTIGLLATVAFFAPVVVFDVGLVTASLTYQAAHGAQYYLMVGTATRPTRTSGMTAIILLLVAGPLFLPLGMIDPYGAQAWMFGIFKGIVAWHFVVDSRLWRLRDAEIRGFMKSRFNFL